jgi:nitroreductase
LAGKALVQCAPKIRLRRIAHWVQHVILSLDRKSDPADGELFAGRLMVNRTIRSEPFDMNTHIGTKQLLDALHWRYATKVFDATRKIPAEIWTAIEQALILSPSSYGLQPYRFLVVNDPKVRETLLPFSWGQKQVVDASHYVVFTARTRVTETEVDEYIRRVVSVRGVPADSLATLRGILIGDVVSGPRSKMAHEWAARQAYIALGNLMTSAALLGVDACPMEGFNPPEYDRALGLQDSEFKAVVACALGYRAATDKYAAAPKVRLEATNLIQRV